MNLKDELEKTWEACLNPNWDGYDACPVTISNLNNTQKLLELLPDNIKKPDVGADPDGSVTLDWFFSINSILSICIKDHYRYALTENRIKSRGTADLYQMKQIILDFLENK